MRPLVDQEDNQDDIRMIFGYRIGDFLQKYRFPREGRRDDHATLTLTDRCEHVHDPS